jgi:hypothetical protein
MATWIILIGVVLSVLILGGAVLVVMVFTREKTPNIRLPGLNRLDRPEADDAPPPGAPQH